MPTIISSTELRSQLADMLKLATRKDYFLIQKRGKITSAVVDIDLFEDLLALSDHTYLKTIRDARAEYQSGQVITHEELFGTK